MTTTPTASSAGDASGRIPEGGDQTPPLGSEEDGSRARHEAARSGIRAASGPMTARQHLVQELRHALATGEDVEGLVDRVVTTGWQPPLLLNRDPHRLEGVLDDGRRIPIRISRAANYALRE